MKLTRRGWVVVGLVLGAIISGALFGPRGLNAIAAPGVVTLIAAAISVARIEQPTLNREAPARGQRGDTVSVRLSFETDRPFSARVRDVVGDGLEADGNVRDTTVGTAPIEYELHLQERGRRSLGPLVVTARDVLGLVSERFRYPQRPELLVRPRVYALTGPRRTDLVNLYGGASDNRQEFDYLRLYQRGDPVRDIHWKSSAKQVDEDLVVKEFVAEESTTAVEIAGEADRGHDDEMAEALASIAVDLLQTGIRVGVTTPTRRIEPRSGTEQRERILDHLAEIGPGRPPQGRLEQAEIRVESTGQGTRVHLGDRAVSFVDLSGVNLVNEETPAPGEHVRDDVAAA